MTGWDDYIQLDPGISASDQALIRRSLNDIWATPEGRDLITRVRQTSVDLIGGPERLTITTRGIPSGREGPDGREERFTATSTVAGMVNLNFDEIERTQYLTYVGNGTRGASLTESLVHELFHASDASRRPAAWANEMNPFAAQLVTSHIRTQPAATDEQRAQIGHLIMVRFMQNGGPLLNGYFQDILNQTNDREEPITPVDEIIENAAPLVSQLTAYINGMSASELRAIADQVGLNRIQLTQRVSGQQINDVMREAITHFREVDIQGEELATDFTDYFMLRHFGVPPRENYSNGDVIAEKVNDIDNLPSRRWFPDMDLGESGLELVALEAQEYNREVLGRVDVPILPYKTLREIERD